MRLWVACVLLAAAVGGIALLFCAMRGKERKSGYVAGIVGLALVAVAAAVYGVLTLVLVGGVT